jgi:hypothetical protein
LTVKYLLRSTLLGSLVILSAAACSSSSDGDDDTGTSAASLEDYDDVAQSMGVAIAWNDGGGDVGSLSDSTDLVVGVPPLDLTVKSAGEFGGIRAGLSYDYALSCSDVSGASLDACGLGTDSANVRVNWSGDLALPNFTASVDRSGDWQVSGVKSGVAQFAGSSDFSFDAKFQSSFRGIEREWKLSYSADYAAVKVQLLPRAVLGGSVHYAVNAERLASSHRGDSEARFSMAADLAFSNTSATLTLDGSHAYAVDVHTGTVSRQTR